MPVNWRERGEVPHPRFVPTRVEVCPVDPSVATHGRPNRNWLLEGVFTILVGSREGFVWVGDLAGARRVEEREVLRFA